jgi:hypothetical protein
MVVSEYRYGDDPYRPVLVDAPLGVAGCDGGQISQHLHDGIRFGGAFVLDHRPYQERLFLRGGETIDAVAAKLRQGGIDKAFRPVGRRFR